MDLAIGNSFDELINALFSIDEFWNLLLQKRVLMSPVITWLQCRQNTQHKVNLLEPSLINALILTKVNTLFISWLSNQLKR